MQLSGRLHELFQGCDNLPKTQKTRVGGRCTRVRASTVADPGATLPASGPRDRPPRAVAGCVSGSVELHMDETDRLRREIRAAREELVRKRARPDGDPHERESRLPLMPDRDEGFLRLALTSVDELETHVERLERDLADLEDGFEPPEE